MKMKVLNFIEINKMSGWQLAPLRKKGDEQVSSWLLSLLVIGM